MPVLTEERTGRIVPPPLWPPGPGGNDGGSNEFGRDFPVSRAQVGLWILLTAIVMLFAGLTSAYIVLRGAPDWQNVTMPAMLWISTGVLGASSIAIEFARRAIKHNQLAMMNQWLVVSGLLGLGFLCGQLLAWRQLVNAGIYLPSTLHSSFFYVLTGAHGVHLVGGIIALGYVFNRAFAGRLTVFNHEPLKLCATYWHFMLLLWVYLFLLLLLA